MGSATDSTFSYGDETSGNLPGAVGSTPGLILVYASGQATLQILPIDAAGLEIGRAHPVLAGYEDPKMSRQHARIQYRNGRFEIIDLHSRNGSALDGQPLLGGTTYEGRRVLRLGQSLFLLCTDIGPYRAFGVKVQEGRVEGPALQQAQRAVARLAGHSPTLFIHGESGAGKESMAQLFHRAGPQPGGPFIAVNCAAIPEGLAERLLFGAQKGAYSGADKDSEGYIRAAHGGTLFLDEIADLDLSVQAKLLRTLESGEVIPLGTTRPKRVDLRVCSATHKDLRALASDGCFRADLYFRLGMPQVSVPPLRQRLEEIPWLVARAAAQVAPGLPVSSLFIESCLLRHWPGNVRELKATVSTAAVQALGNGARHLCIEQLSSHAGAALVAPSVGPDSALPAVPNPRQAPSEAAPGRSLPADGRRAPPSRRQILVALLDAGGNLSAAARSLGLHRTQLRRHIEDLHIDLDRLRDMERE